MKSILLLSTVATALGSSQNQIQTAETTEYKNFENKVLEDWYKQPRKSLGNKSLESIDRNKTYNTLRDSFGVFTFQAADKLNAWVDACGTKNSEGVFTYQPLRFAQIMWSAYLASSDTQDDINKSQLKWVKDNLISKDKIFTSEFVNKYKYGFSQVMGFADKTKNPLEWYTHELNNKGSVAPNYIRDIQYWYKDIMAEQTATWVDRMETPEVLAKTAFKDTPYKENFNFNTGENFRILPILKLNTSKHNSNGEIVKNKFIGQITTSRSNDDHIKGVAHYKVYSLDFAGCKKYDDELSREAKLNQFRNQYNLLEIYNFVNKYKLSEIEELTNDNIWKNNENKLKEFWHR